MTIGANDILKTSTEISQDKSSKKKDFTSEDFSTISNQFANIFNTQFASHFNNQFNYSANNGKKADFMANTATSMTENKYYAPASNPNSTSADNSRNTTPAQTTQGTTTSQKETETKPTEALQTQNLQQNTTPTSTNTAAEANSTQASTQTESNENEQKTEVQEVAKNVSAQKEEVKQEHSHKKNAETSAENIVIANTAANTVAQAAANTSAAVKDKKEDTKNTTGTVQKTDNIKVAIKEDQIKNIKNVTEMAQQTTINQTPVSEVKDAKIEKLEVKTAKKASQEAKKETDTKAEAEKNTDAKIDTKAKVKTEETEKAVDGIKNKASLERLTANVVETTPSEPTALDKILNKDTKKALPQTKETAEAKTQTVEFKNPTAFANQNSEQNFGQSQNNQNPLKESIFKGITSLDTSFFKNSIQGNMPFGNIMQNIKSDIISDRTITEQVMNHIKNNISAEKSEVSMVLNPEHLGKITLNVMNEKGVLSAEIKAETKEAAEALNKNISDLKETLKEQGIICTNLVVKVDDGQKSDNQTNFANQNPDHTPRNFEQGENAQNSDKNSFQNSSNNKESAKAEHQNNIQEEQDQSVAKTQNTEDNGLVDYRV